MTQDISIACKDVTVRYDMFSHKVGTLKEYFIRKVRGDLTSSTKTALNKVTFFAQKGECVALVGHNGCGKSTLLKCLAGILQPVEGTVTVSGRIAPIIELGAGFDPEMTGRENVYLSCSLLGLSKEEIDSKISEIESFSELKEFFDVPVKTYSSGMYMRLGFACTTAIDADVVLIDEILAVGDENFQKKCLTRIQKIRSSGATIVLVTHDLNTVLTMADRVYVFDEGCLRLVEKPAAAIAFYHQLMDQKRFAALSLEEQEEELRRKRLLEKEGNEELGVRARFRRVWLDGPDELLSWESGKRLQLNLEVEIFEHQAESVIVGFALHNEENRRIFGGNTRVFGKDAPPARLCQQGVHKITFHLDGLHLASGRYHIIAAIHNAKLDNTLDLQGRAAEFRAIEPCDPLNFDRDLLSPFFIVKSQEILEVH